MSVFNREATINVEDFLRLATKLPNLEVVGLIVDSSVTQADVLKFVRSCENLRKIKLVYTNEEFSRSFVTEIDELFDVEILWDAVAREGSITIQHKYKKTGDRS